MKWIKNRLYLFLFLGMGIVYLSCVDKWQVYATALEQIKSWSQAAGPSLENGSESTDGEAGPSHSENHEGNSSPEENPGDGSGESAEPEGSMPGESQTPPEGSVSGESQMPPEGSVPGENVAGESMEPSEGEPSASGEASGEENGGEPVYNTVEDDYFADAVFIGDSRTVGLFEYGGLEEITAFYASKGLTVYKMFDSPIVSVPEQRDKITIEEALQTNSFAKIYLMIGINEMGTGTVDSFMEKYQEAVAHLQELQPDAIIYLQAIIRVTAERSAKGDYIHNEGIQERNERIAQLADNKKIFFLDVNPLICDENGGMIPEYTFDGVHLKAKYIEIWKDYLKSHAIFP